MEPASQCIGTSEPAFMIAMALGLASAALLARALVRLEAKLQGRPHVFVRRSLAWAAAQGAVFVGPILLTVGLHAWRHPERQLCTSLVWRWYFVPPILLVVVGVSWGVLNAARQRRVSKQV
jgi:hypothetical protein